MKKFKKLLFYTLALLLIIPIIVGIIQAVKPLPEGISVNGEFHQDGEVRFVSDVTYEKNGRVMEHHLYDEAIRIIGEAQQTLLIDMFLFNDDYDRSKGNYPNNAFSLTDAIVEAKTKNPQLDVTIMTDRINTVYGTYLPPHFQRLQDAGITLIETNMKPLRDSNPIYSSIWRSYLQWWPATDNVFLPNAFNPDGVDVTIDSYLELINFKANHRKIVLNEKEALLSSANITHDGSSFHSNIGFIVSGNILKDIYASEAAVAKLSAVELPEVTWQATTSSSNVNVKLVTEGKIKEQLLTMINETKAEDEIKLGVFYMSDREVVKALKNAAARGVHIHTILDPNKDAFGLEKNGIPNRQIAAELIDEGAIIRWYDTQGEQFHSKFIFVKSSFNDTAKLLGGSANFTRRNLDDLNLESNLYIEMASDSELALEIEAYFDRMWNNENGQFTVAYEVYEDNSIWKKALYRFQEATGLSTF